jgi:preprotein translocase subunit YajC
MQDLLSLLAGLSPILIMVVVFYFFLIRPQQKRQKQVSQMQQNLAKGDQIITIGGLHGTVDAIDEDVVVIKVNENNRLRFDRSAIRSVTQQEQA